MTEKQKVRAEARAAMRVLRELGIIITPEIRKNFESKSSVIQVDNYRRSLIAR